MKKKKEYTLPLEVDKETLLLRLNKITCDKPTIKNSLSGNKYYGNIGESEFKINSISQRVELIGKIEENQLIVEAIWDEITVNYFLLISLLGSFFVIVFSLLNFIKEGINIGSILFSLIMLVAMLVVAKVVPKLFGPSQANPESEIETLRKLSN